MLNKKGQGLSLDVIIIAAIALVVLVLLVAIFTGRIAIFQKLLGTEANTELNALKAFYGKCHPSSAAESTFESAYNAADALDDVAAEAQDKAEAKAELQAEINRCNVFATKEECGVDCRWS